MVEFKSFRQNVDRAYATAKREALERMGLTFEGVSARYIPVDTGNLRNSRAYTVLNDSVMVGVTAYYGPFVELGTSKMNAQPFIRPSVLNHKNEYKSAVESAFKGIK